MAQVHVGQHQPTAPGAMILQMFFKVETISVKTKITLGRSGASVFFVFVADAAGGTRLAVAKIQELNSLANETELHKQATAMADVNSMGHIIPEIIDEVEIDGWSGVLYGLAGTTVLRGNTLNHAINEEIPELSIVLESVSSFVYNWNKPYRVEERSPYELVQLMLGSRFLDKKLLDRFSSVAVNAHDKWIMFIGVDQLFPNPLYYLSDKDNWNGKTTLTCSVPNHGDLHGDNIILSRDTLNVIDFGELQPESSLFYDGRYLELHLLMDYLSFSKDMDRNYWNLLCATMCSSMSPQIPIPPGSKSRIVSEVVPTLRNQISLIADKPTMELLEPTFYLAGVAAGINFFRKTRDLDKARAALLYACYNLSAMLKHPAMEMFPGSGRTGSYVSWYGSETSDLRTEADILYEKISDDKFDLVLVIGPGLLSACGFPTDFEVLSAITDTSSLNKSMSELTMFDYTMSQVESTDVFKLSYIDKIESQLNKDEMRKTLDVLMKPNWKGILTWGVSTEPFQYIVNSGGNLRFDDVNNASDGSTQVGISSPWVYLRGDSSNYKSLVLGRNEWGGIHSRQKRIQFLIKFGSNLEREPRYVIAGFDTEEQTLLLEELKGTHPGADCLVVSDSNMDTSRFWQRPAPVQLRISIQQLMSLLETVHENRIIPNHVNVCRITFNRNGTSESFTLKSTDYNRVSKYIDVLHDGLPQCSGANDGEFYFGKTISWSELNKNLDVERNIAGVLQEQLLKDLQAGFPYRVNLVGEPGAGTTTIGLRTAWNIYFKFQIPVLVIKQYGPEILDHLRFFDENFERGFLLIADEQFIRFDDSERLFDTLKKERIPAVMLRIYHGDRYTYSRSDQSTRSFFLADELDLNDERPRFVNKLSPLVSEEKQAVLKQPQDSILLYMLTAFEREFIGVERFVRAHLSASVLSYIEEKTLVNTALATYFAKHPMSVTFIANTFNLNQQASPSDKYSSVLACLRKYANRLFVEKPLPNGQFGYAARHDLIAEEILKTILGSSWKQVVCSNLADMIRILPAEGPGSQLGINFCYSLVRGDTVTTRNVNGKKIRTSWLTKFIQDNNLSGLKTICERCALKFEDEPHLLAHLARYYYEFTLDYGKAREIMNDALQSSEECTYDSTLNQMMGMTYKRELESMIKSREPDLTALWQVLNNAEAWFRLAWERGRNKEDPKAYGAYIGAALSLMDYGLNAKIISEGDDNYTDILGIAEEVLDEAKFYLDYDDGSYLYQLEERVRAYRQDVDLQRIRTILTKSDNRQVQMTYLHRVNDQIVQAALLSSERDQQTLSLVKDLKQIMQSQPSRQISIWWCIMSLRLKEPPLEEIEEELLRIASPHDLRSQFYLMCVQFMLMLRGPSIDLYNRYQKAKSECATLSLQPSQGKRREMIGRDIRLIQGREIKDETDALERFTGITVVDTSPDMVRPFRGFVEQIPAFRNRGTSAVSVRKGDRLKGYFGLTLKGPRLFSYERDDT